jgi:outer membrane lipoprotein-sorting protein
MKKRTILMNAIFRYACGGVFLIFAYAASQEPPIMKTVRAMYTTKTSLETKIDLHIFWKVREREETKSGVIFLAPGDKFRVELAAAIWVSNGETYWQSDKDDKGVQVVIKRLADVNVALHPSHVLNTYVEKYVYRLKEETGSVAVVEWNADSLAGQTEATVIRMSIDKKSGKIFSLFIVDKSGNETTYTFKKTKFPEKLPEKLFEYTPPKGASILDMRN